MKITKTAVVQIGNSDNKLTQQEWAEFIRDIDVAIKSETDQVYFLALCLIFIRGNRMVEEFEIVNVAIPLFGAEFNVPIKLRTDEFLAECGHPREYDAESVEWRAKARKKMALFHLLREVALQLDLKELNESAKIWRKWLRNDPLSPDRLKKNLEGLTAKIKAVRAVLEIPPIWLDCT